MSIGSKIFKLFVIFSIVSISLFAGGVKLQYKLKPGQKWVCSLSSKNESSFMGEKSIDRSKREFIYKISKGKKQGWVSISANIKSSPKDKESGMDMSRMSFKADMHKSGELRHVQYSGSPFVQQSANIPPEMQAMMDQQENMIGNMYKNAVFWFPELPEEKLQVGDEFDVKRAIGTGGGAMQTKTLIKQVFTLEDVSKGLAYFSVKQKSLTKTKSQIAGKSETKMLGKGEAIFDLNSGMWLEVTEKSRAKISLSGIAGMGDMSSDMKIVSKYEMEMK